MPPRKQVQPGNAWCGTCKAEKPTDLFHRDRSRASGFYPKCKPCRDAYKARPEVKARRREYYADYVVVHKEQRRANYRKARYGTDDLTLRQMFDEQDGLCANSGCREPLDFGTAHVDHDRSCCPGRKSCGQCVRALLCPGCNVGLGFFRDNPARLRGIAEYIERTRR